MKRKLSLTGFAVLTAIIALSITACPDGYWTGGGSGKGELPGEIVIDNPPTAVVGTELSADYSGSEPVSFQWYKDGVPIQGATLPEYTPTEPGSYTVTVSSSGKSKTSAPVVIRFPDLEGEITLPGGTTADVGEELSAEYDGEETVTYQWYKDGVAIPGATDSEYTPTEAGTYTVTISAPGRSSKTSDPIIVGGGAAVPVTGVTLNKTTLTLTAGDSETLTATVAPSNATNKAVTWSTSNAAVATVNNGIVTAVSAGTATITVTTTDGSKTETCTVTVTAATVPVLNTIEAVQAYLPSASGGTASNPVALEIEFDLGVMTEAASNWQQLLGVIAAADKHVNLDLSAAGMASMGTPPEFNPDSSVTTGKNRIVSIKLPDAAESIIDGTNAASSAFNNFSALKSVDLNSVTSIGNRAFYDTGLTGSLTIPDSVTSICNWAFYSCNGLTGSLTIPDSVTSIGNYAFYLCNGLTGSLTIPDSVTSIGDSTFRACGFTSVTIPDSVTSIGQYAFANCYSLESVTIPDSVTSIGQNAFWMCSSLTSVTIPNSVDEIWYSAFAGCTSLASVTIGNSVNSIRDSAFEGCTSLTSVTIPNSVSVIWNSAFKDCTSLTSVTFKGNVNYFYGDNFPGDLVNKYKAVGGGSGTYTRPDGNSDTWTKQSTP